MTEPGGVQRHDIGVAGDMVWRDDGDWVRYGDIAGMAGENARLRKALVDITAVSEHTFADGAAKMQRIATEALRGAAGEAIP